jgi:uncharacterized protein DUF1259
MFRTDFRQFLSIAVVLFLATTVQVAQTPSPTSDWKPVEDALGRAGPVSGDVIRFAMPRRDLHVTLDGVEIKPALALGSSAAFEKDGNAAMVMGDLVLTEAEIQAVMAKLQEGGIQESAVHNHLIGESRRILYMHVVSHGDPVQMAKAIRDTLVLTRTPPADTGATPAPTSDLGFDQKQVEQARGRSGKVNGGVLQVGVPRSETITDSGIRIPPSMGVATALNFKRQAMARQQSPETSSS